MEKATFGAGCYWGTEKFFRKAFQLSSAAVGFMGGSVENPIYKNVCSGNTGHVEVCHLEFDPSTISYRDLVRHFFSFHDPTTFDRQGNDAGDQYASVIFYHNEEQKRVAEEVKRELQELLTAGKVTSFERKEVITSIRPASTFYPAHEEHQLYLEKNPGGYCNHRFRFKWDQ
eukprot:NODE_8584_length_665_cov_39.234317_g7959_i0.p1 GENE.NODE_8584_length_665_cov_39.234317_g7959_i0~~NODE_8584_length_665_cov_39.234317_g7959_i0.p1  ORF type:complete len:172 (+),score=24.65 NODE_8584_length_665_cov_39.234317_g7959_i0:62-577(+)